ncbi:MAG TPA: thiamine phosphate synthase [Candidatus Acidoferrales bacterium]|nr:thiamine phosphate synthase [Candidatus Acidoferrales bacterium]
MLLCYVTDRHLLGGSVSLHDLLRQIERAAAAGVDWIQVREKDLTARDLDQFTRRAISACNRAGVSKTPPSQIVINDRVDVALAAGAAGVHLTEASTPPAETVQWLRTGNAPENFAAGVSCHSPADAIAAEKAGANYIFFGPVYETPSKVRFGEPQGLGKLSEVCRAVRIPVLAIGGVSDTNAAACIRAGAAGIAAIRLFQQVVDLAALEAVVGRLRLHS